jgi:hypothetical protein
MGYVARDVFPRASLAHASGYEKPFAVLGGLNGKKRNFKECKRGMELRRLLHNPSS